MSAFYKKRGDTHMVVGGSAFARKKRPTHPHKAIRARRTQTGLLLVTTVWRNHRGSGSLHLLTQKETRERNVWCFWSFILVSEKTFWRSLFLPKAASAPPHAHTSGTLLGVTDERHEIQLPIYVCRFILFLHHI